MKLNLKKPRDYLNPLLSKRNNVNPKEFERFKDVFKQYKIDVDEQHAAGQTEPNIVTNILKPFSLSFNLCIFLF